MPHDHNAEADYAGSELARLFAANPSLCYPHEAMPAGISATASSEPSVTPWPKADGVVSILEGGGPQQRHIAVEYKRQQEGVHGLLTALGQAYAYLHKGYNGAAIVIPGFYSSLAAPGDYVKGVLDNTTGSDPIGVFCYEEPDTSSPTPFAGKLNCIRQLKCVVSPNAISTVSSIPTTQWVHMREGSTTRDGFFRFLQTAKMLSTGREISLPALAPELVAAINRIVPDVNPWSYLANIADDRFLSRVWHSFWFEHIFTPEVATPWILEDGHYSAPGAYCGIERDDGRGPSQIFEGRADGLKENLAMLLNEGVITEDQAWNAFVAGIERPGRQKKQGVRDRAHSYREDVDSSLAQLEWIDSDGRPTDYGYHYMTICERYGGGNSVAAREYVGATLLQTGRYAAFLHYVYRLSERKFGKDPLAFTRETAQGGPIFDEDSYTEYLAYIEGLMADELRVIRKVAGRARPRRRTTFQAELTLLRNYGFVSRRRYRLGVGIPINWERVLEALDVDL